MTAPPPQQKTLTMLADHIPLQLTPANADAWKAICQWHTWPDGCMALAGPAASGKSSMTAAWSSHTNANRLDGRSLAAMSLSDIHALADRALAIDDAHGAGETLLTALNLCRNHPLLMTGTDPPSAWPMLTRDLQSRLDAIPVSRIDPPCDATMRTLLTAACRKHLIRLPGTTCRYLVRHMPHSYAAIAGVAEAMALSGASANLTTARSVLGRLCDEHACA